MRNNKHGNAFSRTKLCTGLLVAFGGLVLVPGSAMAQDSTSLQRVEITGSSIKRLATESALPITSIKADDFVKQGLTTAQEILNTIPMNQSSQGASQSVGSGTGGKSDADLRGLGSDKTLVLLNGRRLANHPYGGASVDLNIIPVSALDRVEILRDGASAIYGTDAIGGVINFITKRSVTGLSVTAEVISPQKAGGGEKRVNLSGGFGNLDADGYNFFGVVDSHKQDVLTATQREFSKTGVILDRGVNKTSGTPFPANFYDATNNISGNPYFATGCRPPYSAPKASNGTCRFDYTQFVDDIPLTQQDSFLGKASFKINADNTATAEYLHAKSTNNNSVAPPPMAGLGITLNSASRFYPGGSAGVPAVAGLTGADLDISWRPLESGNRTQLDESVSDRFLLGLEGTVAGWDYKTGISYSESKATSTFTGGYLVDQRIIDGVGSGVLNPFGAQDAAGAAYLTASLLKGQFLNASMKSSAIDFKASKELMQLPAGPLGFAIGGEFRSDKADYKVDRALAGQASSSGYAEALDQSGDRTIAAVFTEFSVPVVKDVELSLAARYDKYSDVGSTFNPKVGVRYQPAKEVMLRGSYNTGFRAPTLYDLHGPQTTTNTSDTYNDPVLCPGGVAVAGANPNIVCEMQQNIRGGGNPDLKPETSKTSTIGIVLEPTKSFTATIDLWKINLSDQISSLPEQTIFGDYAKYSSLYHYSADGKTLLYVLGTQANLGEVHTRGVDISLTWRLPKSSAGTFVATLDGTYVDLYEYQNEKNGPFTQNAGVYADASPVMRWRHNAAVQWTDGPWSVTVSQKFQSGYTDQNAVAAAYVQDVGSYSTWSVSGTYTGVKNLSLTAGIKNLFDKDPPFTNQGTTFQQGYDPRYTDPVGRAVYVRGTYKFM